MMDLSAYLQGLRHPEAFQGTGRKGKYFEGWYVKLVSSDQSARWAIIPGIFQSENKEGIDEAFIQVLDGSSGESWYHRFEGTEFEAAPDRFAVSLGGNHFDTNGVELSLPGLRGRVDFLSRFDPWPVKPLSPGVMGWYGLVPFMECFHGIVSFGHRLGGSLEIDGVNTNFDSGRGYIEKDWGKSFPEGYLWLHSNHIGQQSDASFFGSVAIIPWLTGTFRGFIVGLKHGGKLYSFTTYGGDKEVGLRINDSAISWKLQGKDGTIEISADRVRGGVLNAPPRSSTYQRVDESLDATIRLRHVSPSGDVLLESTGTSAGMEVFGDIQMLLGLKKK